MRILILILLFSTLSCGETKQAVVTTLPKVERLKKNEVKLVRKSSSVFEVSVELNNSLKIPMLLDSGASDVALPPYIVYTLIKTGTLQRTDFLAPQSYTIANGSSEINQRFLIRELRIGDHVIKNVECSMSNSDLSPCLIGQSLLSKFKRVTVDNNKEVLILEK